MSQVTRNCNCCGKEYQADSRNLNRGWGLHCSKSCAAKTRESKKPKHKRYSSRVRTVDESDYRLYEDDHPFSSEALGQW